MGGAGEAVFSLPVTSAALGTTLMPRIGDIRIVDAGASPYYGTAEWINTTTAQVRTYLLNAAPGIVVPGSTTSSAPFTWTTNDSIYITGTYEAA